MKEFYEHLDIVFDILIAKYGLQDDIIDSKESLLKIYDDENNYRYSFMHQNIKHKKIHIDENGYVSLHS